MRYLASAKHKRNFYACSYFVLVGLFITNFSSCIFGNSNGPQSDSITGKWAQNRSIHQDGMSFGIYTTSGYTLAWMDTLILEKSGKGKFITKDTKIFDTEGKSTSSAVEFPIEWQTKNEQQGNCLVIKYNPGKITEIVAEDKLKVEQDAIKTLKAYDGITDSTYFFSIDNGKTVRWNSRYSKEKVEWVKLP